MRGYGTPKRGFWGGREKPQTLEGDGTLFMAFLLGTPSLEAAGCSMPPILHLACAFAILCILHLTMDMGRLLGEFVGRGARGVSPSVRQDLQILLSERMTGCNVYGVISPDGEELGCQLFLRHGQKLLGALATGRDQPSTRPF